MDIASNKELIERVFETLPIPVSVKRLDGSYEIVNRAWETTMGHARIDIIGKYHHDLADSQFNAKVAAAEQRLL